MIDAAFTQIKAIAGTRAACVGVGRSRASHYRRGQSPRLGPPAPRPTPPNALSSQEVQAVLDVLHSKRFADAAPAQVWATMLDEGRYLGSESTMYRLLRRGGEVSERRRQAIHPPRAVPELLAGGPNQVWSYDATALKGPARGIHYDLLVMIDIFSRYVTGWNVVNVHDGHIVKAWIDQVTTAQHIKAGTLTIHSDRGSPMTSKPVAVLLADLRIGQTHSRPQVSNDNLYSEAAFKTLKYCPAFPERFGSLADARSFAAAFFKHYNHEHRHSGIGLYSPASVHFGTAVEVRARRAEVLAAAYGAHPERFVDKAPVPPPLPGPAWINKPQEPETAQKES